MLPEAIKEPLAIIQSQTCPDRAVVILQMEHNNKKIITAVEVDGQGRHNNTLIDSNALTTLFAKGNAISQLKTAIENTINGKNELFYWNKKEALTLLQTKGLQLPSSLPGEDFVNSIRNNSSNVKTKFIDVTESLQFKRWFGNSKAVNNDGSPKILYHRTNADFVHKRAEHLTVLTDRFLPDTAADGSEICPILPFSCPDKNLLLLKLRAPKTDYFC